MKISKIMLNTVLLFSAVMFNSAHAEVIAEQELGWSFIQETNLVVHSFKDPKIPGVACYVSNIVVSFSFSDPSDMSIACRQVGPISHLPKFKPGEEVFRLSKSVLFKSMKIKRWYDAKNHVIVYTSFSEKVVDGSHKNSLSVVSLFGTEYYNGLKGK